MNCPRCNAPAADETLREFGGVCPKCLLAFTDEKDAPAFPNLEIVEIIGQGGMGVVYKALQKNLNRTVALKVLSPQLSDDPEFIERFTREARALASLSHPNIVAIHDSGVHDRVPYLIMEYVEGTSLRKLLEARTLTAEQVLKVVPQICDALQYAHGRGVVHRDIKPENILIDAEGRVKIADYGLAKIASIDQPRITRSNLVMGTPHYMAPEQIENSSQVDHRADIYSLGVIFYEMLTGELPLGRFKAPSEKGGGDRRLDPVVLKTLEKEPADRYQSAGDVKEQLSKLSRAPSRPKTRPPYVPPQRLGGLRRAAFISANIGGLFLASGFGVSLFRERALMGVAEVLLVIGWMLLLTALLIGALHLAFRAAASMIDPDRKEPASRRWWTVLTATLGVAILLFIASLIPGPPKEASKEYARLLEPPAPRPGLREVRQVWSEDLPTTSLALGLLAGDRSVLVASKESLREFDWEDGRFISIRLGPFDALPVRSFPWVACWGSGRLTILEEHSDGFSPAQALDVPVPGTVVGLAIRNDVLYGCTDARGAFAIELRSGGVLWVRKDLDLPPIAEPVVTDLDLVIFDGKSSRLLLNRESGRTKVMGSGAGGSSVLIQWEKGWATLRREGIQITLDQYFKGNLAHWAGRGTGSTADLERCHFVLSGNNLVCFTETEIFGQAHDEPFGKTWNGALPRTVGSPAALGDGWIAAPTIRGIHFFRDDDGEHASAKVAGTGDYTMVAGKPSRVAAFSPASGKLSVFSTILSDQPRKR